MERGAPATTEMAFAEEPKLRKTERRAIDSVACRIALVCAKPFVN